MDRRKFIKASIGAISTVFVAPLVTQLPVPAPVLPKLHDIYISREALEDIKNWAVIDEQTGAEIYNNYEGEWYITYMEC